MEEYKIRLGASAYFDKGILTEDDLKEINTGIEDNLKKSEENSEFEENEDILEIKDNIIV